MTQFETTKWSLILAAREQDRPAGREALAELCQIYWYPLFAFARKRSGCPDTAADMTQSFFTFLIERVPLERVDPSLGRFRSFLLVSFKNFLSHERDRARAIKRGGALQVVSLDAQDGERRFQGETRDDWTPEDAFEYNWAHAVLERVAARLERELNGAGKQREFRALSGFLTGDGDNRPYREVAAQLGVSEAAVKMGVQRLRRRYGALLRDEIVQTVREPEDVDGELKHLLRVCRGR